MLTEGLSPIHSEPRGEEAFGSTGPAGMLTVDLKSRPRRTVAVAYQGQTVTLTVLLDTGADVSIISTHHWPYHWPTFESGATVAGVGGLTLARKSPPLQWTIAEQVVNCCASIIPLPPGVAALVGRDILAQMGMVLTTDPNL